MGYAVRSLRRSGQHKAKARAVRHRSYYVPAGGSLAYTITGDEVMTFTDASSLDFSGAGAGGGGGRVRPLQRSSGVRVR